MTIRTILVDDEPLVLDLVVRVLRADGHDVLCAGGVKHAQRLLEEAPVGTNVRPPSSVFELHDAAEPLLIPAPIEHR